MTKGHEVGDGETRRNQDTKGREKCRPDKTSTRDVLSRYWDDVDPLTMTESVVGIPSGGGEGQFQCRRIKLGALSTHGGSVSTLNVTGHTNNVTSSERGRVL